MPQQNRQTAYKVRISDVINGPFVKSEGWEANHVVVNGLQVARVNLICIVVSKEFNENYKSIVVDDGSAKISVKSFDNKFDFDNFEVGDSILLIARLREFSGERYLTPEIMKKVENKKWLELRKLEIKPTKKEQKIFEEDVKETSADRVIAIIKNLDKGDGVNFEDLVNHVKDENLVFELLKQGDIFELRPGKLKVLE